MSIADLNSSNVNLSVNSLTLNNQQSNKTLSVYKEYQQNYTLTGPYPTPLQGTCLVTIMDDEVSVSFPGTISGSSFTTSIITLTPSSQTFPKPVRDTIFAVTVFSTNTVNNSPVPGWGKIDAGTGIITINSVAPTTFFSSTGFPAFTLKYNLN